LGGAVSVCSRIHSRGHLLRLSALQMLTNTEFAPFRFSKTAPRDSRDCIVEQTLRSRT
jgi:hypothetical protein